MYFDMIFTLLIVRDPVNVVVNANINDVLVKW